MNIIYSPPFTNMTPNNELILNAPLGHFHFLSSLLTVLFLLFQRLSVVKHREPKMYAS